MTDPADFLSRWSRRKREAANAASGLEIEKAPEQESDAVPKADFLPGTPEKEGNTAAAEAKPEEIAFDISQLPSIESITAETDIRAFLGAGVPAALRQAALRRAWSADPKIRDFIEMAENQMDFNAPGEILGFDFSAPTGDIKRMIADIYGKLPAGESETESHSKMPPATSKVPASVPTDGAISAHRNVLENLSGDEEGEGAVPAETHFPNDAVRQTLLVQPSDRDGASQKNNATQDSGTESRRPSHGRAMPK